jgi:hypothetical protein
VQSHTSRGMVGHGTRCRRFARYSQRPTDAGGSAPVLATCSQMARGSAGDGAASVVPVSFWLTVIGCARPSPYILLLLPTTPPFSSRRLYKATDTSGPSLPFPSLRGLHKRPVRGAIRSLTRVGGPPAPWGGNKPGPGRLFPQAPPSRG